MNAPELAAGVIKIILCGLESLCRCGRSNPPTADRLDHSERFQRVRGIAQVLVGAMKLLPLLLREFRWLAAYLHVAPLRAPDRCWGCNPNAATGRVNEGRPSGGLAVIESCAEHSV